MLHFLHRRNNQEVPEVELTVSTRTLIRIVIIVILTLAVVSFFLKVTHALLLVFIAFFFALALNAPVSWIAKRVPGKKRGSRSIATTLSFLVVVILIGAFAAYIIPPIVHQTEKFISAAPSLVKDAQNQHSALGQFIRRHHLQGAANSVSKQLAQRFGGISGTAFSSLSSIAGSLVSILAVVALTFMMLVEGPRWMRVFRDLFVPEKGIKEAERITGDMYKVVKGYVNGQVTLAFIAAVLIVPVLLLVHVSYPVALMVVVFLCALVPLIGHTIGAIIVSIVALFHSVPSAIIILAYYIFYIQFENYLLQPRIQANTTNMSPLLVFASIIIGVSYGGLIGGLVAIPIAACLKVLVVEYLTQKKMLPKDFMGEDL